MALIDEYKQAIKDVLDGRAKAAPSPSALPLTEDKLATLWAAAAAELIAEESGGSSGGGVLIVTETEVDSSLVLDKTWQEIFDAGFSVLKTSPQDGEIDFKALQYVAWDADGYYVGYGNQEYTAASASDYPVAHVE